MKELTIIKDQITNQGIECYWSYFEDHESSYYEFKFCKNNVYCDFKCSKDYIKENQTKIVDTVKYYFNIFEDML